MQELQLANTVYIVAGMHRSGTSLVTRMLAEYDIALPGELVGPAEGNPKGFSEHRAVVEINERLLERLELRWDSIDGFFLGRSDFSSPGFNHIKKKARVLVRERQELDTSWAFKDPRMSRLAPFWLLSPHRLRILRLFSRS